MAFLGENLLFSETSALKTLTGDKWPIPVPADELGQPLNSWRFQLSPWTHGLDETWPGPANLAAAWDAPTNEAFANDKMHNLFTAARADDPSQTYLFGVIGPDSAFDKASVQRYSDLPPDIIVLIEIADSKTHWMQPGDYNVTELLAYNGRIGDHLHGLLPDRLHVLFADGEVWALSPDAPVTSLQPFLTIAGAKSHNRDQLLLPHRVDGPE